MSSTSSSTPIPKKSPSCPTTNNNNNSSGGNDNTPRSVSSCPTLEEKASNVTGNVNVNVNSGNVTRRSIGSGSGSSSVDSHPYARGSIVEVIWGVSKKIRRRGNASFVSVASTDEDDDSSSCSSEDSSKRAVPEVRLCDIIDRTLSHGSSPPQWKYYVHYRDLNRRMDEWVTTDRIVSPPSVGASKAKAKSVLRKKEEERKKKHQEAALQSLHKKRNKEKNSSGNNNNNNNSNSVSSHSSNGTHHTINNTQHQSHSSSTQSHSHSSFNDTPNPTEDMTTEGPRLTRRQKRTRANQSQSSTNEDTTAASSSLTSHTHNSNNNVIATLPPQELDEHEGLDEASLREHEEVTKVKNVHMLELGRYQMETWYFSPIPYEGIVDLLYVCEFTLSFFTRKKDLTKFQNCPKRNIKRYPPGNEIYRRNNLSMFEVDGLQERTYCQNLCYIAKLFLDHKTLYYDVDPFLFYILCERDHQGYHPVGYFSKEKYSDVGYNLACILTFPSHQRKGYGRLLIAFSYELSKKEEKVGSPEKPMSDLGQSAYKPYWTSTIVDFLANHTSRDCLSISIMDISKKTSIMPEDVIFTLHQLGILKFINGVHFITAGECLLKDLMKKHSIKEPRVIPHYLHWTPFYTDIKRDKFSIHSKRPSVETGEDHLHHNLGDQRLLRGGDANNNQMVV